MLCTGTAFATSELAANSVGTKQLRPVAVTAAKVAKRAVTTSKIKPIAIKQGKIESGAVTSAKIAAGAVTAEKIAKGAVTAEKISDLPLSGAKIDEAALGQVPSAATANVAGFAESSNPEAFAHVSREAVVSLALSRGIGTTDVKEGPEPGIYCVNVPGFIPRGAQASPEYAQAPPIYLDHNDVSVYVKFAGTEDCPYPEIEVQTYNNGGRVKEPFFIAVYR